MKRKTTVETKLKALTECKYAVTSLNEITYKLDSMTVAEFSLIQGIARRLIR